MNQNAYNLLDKHGILNITSQVNDSFLFGFSCSFSAFTLHVHTLKGEKEDRLPDINFALLTLAGSLQGFHFETSKFVK